MVAGEAWDNDDSGGANEEAGDCDCGSSTAKTAGDGMLMRDMIPIWLVAMEFGPVVVVLQFVLKLARSRAASVPQFVFKRLPPLLVVGCDRTPDTGRLTEAPTLFPPSWANVKMRHRLKL